MTIFALIVIAYITESVIISCIVNNIAEESYNNMGENSSYSSIIDDDIYYNLCYRSEFLDNGVEHWENNKRSFPITIHWFFGGKVIYYFDYEAVVAGYVARGGWNINVHLQYSLGVDGLKFYSWSEGTWPDADEIQIYYENK